MRFLPLVHLLATHVDLTDDRRHLALDAGELGEDANLHLFTTRVRQLDHGASQAHVHERAMGGLLPGFAGKGTDAQKTPLLISSKHSDVVPCHNLLLHQHEPADLHAQLDVDHSAHDLQFLAILILRHLFIPCGLGMVFHCPGLPGLHLFINGSWPKVGHVAILSLDLDDSCQLQLADVEGAPLACCELGFLLQRFCQLPVGNFTSLLRLLRAHIFPLQARSHCEQLALHVCALLVQSLQLGCPPVSVKLDVDALVLQPGSELCEVGPAVSLGRFALPPLKHLLLVAIVGFGLARHREPGRVAEPSGAAPPVTFVQSQLLALLRVNLVQVQTDRGMHGDVRGQHARVRFRSGLFDGRVHVWLDDKLVLLEQQSVSEYARAAHLIGFVAAKLGANRLIDFLDVAVLVLAFHLKEHASLNMQMYLANS